MSNTIKFAFGDDHTITYYYLTFKNVDQCPDVKKNKLFEDSDLHIVGD